MDTLQPQSYTSTRAGVLLLLWSITVVLSLLMAPFSTIAAGYAIGSIVSAGAVLLVIRWSVQDMLQGAMDNITQVEDQMPDQNDFGDL